MAFVTIRVSAPTNRRIYVDGGYGQSAGNSSTDSFTVPSGGHIFETLNGSDQVDYRKKFRVRPTDTELTIALDPVSPPEPI